MESLSAVSTGRNWPSDSPSRYMMMTLGRVLFFFSCSPWQAQPCLSRWVNRRDQPQPGLTQMFSRSNTAVSMSATNSVSGAWDMTREANCMQSLPGRQQRQSSLEIQCGWWSVQCTHRSIDATTAAIEGMSGFFFFSSICSAVFSVSSTLRWPGRAAACVTSAPRNIVRAAVPCGPALQQAAARLSVPRAVSQAEASGQRTWPGQGTTGQHAQAAPSSGRPASC